MSIPNSIKKPGFYTEANTSGALRGSAAAISILLLGQITSAGSWSSGEMVQAFDVSQARSGAGEGSQLALMVEAALTANPNCAPWCLPMADNGSSKATGDVTFSGAATASGTVTLYVGNRQAVISVASGDDDEAVAAALVAKMPDVVDLPVTSTVNGSDAAQVDLIARNAGTQGNDIPLEVVVDVPGITASVTAFASGATDPDLTTFLDTAAAERFDIIVVSLNDATSMGKLKTHLEEVSGPLEQRPGLGFVGFRGALADATTLTDGVDDGRVTFFHLRGTRSLSFEIAAATAAVIAAEEDVAVPLAGSTIAGLHAPVVAQRFTRTEQETLLANGVAPLEVGSGERVKLVSWVTTFQTNEEGNPDETLLYGNTLRVLDAFRMRWRARMADRFGAGAPGTNRKLITKNLEKIRGETIALMFEMEGEELLRDTDDVKDDVVAVESTSAQSRIDVVIPSRVVPGLRIVTGTFNLSL